MSPEMQAAVTAEAMSWLRTPYHHMGRLKGVGVDCGQLPLAVYQAAGVIPPTSVGHYQRDWNLHQREEIYLRWAESLAQEVGRRELTGGPMVGEAPRAGDFGLWRWGTTFSHGGIFVSECRIVHAVVGVGVTMDDVTHQAELSRQPMRLFRVGGAT